MSLHNRLAHALGVPRNMDGETMIAMVRALRAQHMQGESTPRPYMRWHDYATALSNEPLSARQLAASMGVTLSSSRQWLCRAKRGGYVVQKGLIYYLTVQGLTRLQASENDRRMQ